MENSIKVLPLDIINQIAAGEVVERPASIVKELLENAVDSNAKDIILNLEKSGLDAITVIDNGSGMNSLEVTTALLQHATSKIYSAEDLTHISSLGFRGEALASISSIAEINIHTYDSKDKPVSVKNIGGKILITTGPGRNRGTTVKVSKIFLNVPARRKFLKSEITEYKYILDTFIDIVLAHPQISFTLIKNTKPVYQLPACPDIQSRLLQINKNLRSTDLIKIQYDDPQITISGLIGSPNLIKQGENWQHLFINGRGIRNALINKAIREGYGTVLMREMTPVYLINFTIDPALVDVNVHPRKLEVRFSDTGRVYIAVKRAISHALEKNLQENLQEQFHSHVSASTQRQFTVKPSLIEGKNITFKTNSIPNSISESIEFTRQLLKDNTQGNLELGNTLQIFDTYIIISKDNKLLMIDQHAADERINFERLSNQFVSNESQSTQKLLIPEAISLSKADIEKLRENLGLLKKIGFDFSEISSSKAFINEIPLLLIEGDIKKTFLEILLDLETTGDTESARWTAVSNKIIATLACHGSIRAGKKLMKSEVEKLIKDLFQCTLPYSCPHGRPIIWELTRTEIEKQFKRKL